jgi:hypothetical protein
VATTMADAGIPKKYWDIVGEHVALVLQMTSPSRHAMTLSPISICCPALAVFVCA